jgi:ubiquinone/menaquinone biosynthesis C-methylase UbiE
VNFEFFPSGSSLLMLDVNPHCEQHMLENLKNFPRLHLKAFVCGSAEQMHQIDTESVDVVVSSRTLCSVDENKTLKEVHRVLRKVIGRLSAIYFCPLIAVY